MDRHFSRRAMKDEDWWMITRGGIYAGRNEDFGENNLVTASHTRFRNYLAREY